MTADNTCEAPVDELRRLQFLTPDPGRAERVRMRCHAQLDRSRSRQARTERVTGFSRRVLTPLIVAGFCLLYMVALVATTLRLR